MTLPPSGRWRLVERVAVGAIGFILFFQRITPLPPTHASEPGQWTYSPEAVQLAAAPLLLSVGQTTLHPDECNGIFPSYQWEELLKLDLQSIYWTEGFWTLTQPPVMRYLIGMGRNMGGYGRNDVNEYYDFSKAPDDNNKLGAVPSPDLLWWSRMPMAVLDIFSLVMLFALIEGCCGHLAAWLFVSLLLMNPFLKDCLARAMTEAPLLFFTSAAMVALVKSLRAWSGERWAPALAWAALAGVFTGIGGAAKLNGLAAAVAGCLVVCVAVFRKGGPPWPRRIGYAASASVLQVALTVAVFVAINPFLYSDPVGRTQKLFQNRLVEMSHQVQLFPDRRIKGVLPRIQIVGDRVLGRLAPFRFRGALVFNLVLGSVGACWLLALFLRWLMARDGPIGLPQVPVLGAFFGVVALPNTLTPIDWDRYFMMPVLFATLFVAAGLALCLRAAMRRFAFVVAP